MKTNQIKFFVIATAVLTFAAATFSAGWNRAFPINETNDTAALYKSKCAACHSSKAEKFFDPTKKDEVLTEIILKGMKAAKPPNMPAFEKTVTPEQAKDLAAYMRQLRAPATAGNTNATVKTNANVNMSVNGNANINANKNANVNSNAEVNTNAPIVNTTATNIANANVTMNANLNVNTNTTLTNTAVNPNPKLAAEIAQIYKTKCTACHTAKAEKFFDSTKSDEQLVEIVLKGKKGAKPPFMPGFEGKGVSAEQAKELIKYMRKLR